jgi:hypothetical protein
MALLITDEFKKYLVGLTATSAIVSAFGTTFTSGTNLFVGEENDAHRDMLTIYPTGGSPPDKDGQKYESSIQIRMKVASNATGLKAMQEVINVFHENTNICASTNGKVFAVQSNPLSLDKLEGGKYSIYVSNYTIKHIKL